MCEVFEIGTAVFLKLTQHEIWDEGPSLLTVSKAETCQSLKTQTGRTMEKMSQNGEKLGKTEKFHKKLYISNFTRENSSHLPQVFLNETLTV